MNYLETAVNIRMETLLNMELGGTFDELLKGAGVDPEEHGQILAARLNAAMREKEQEFRDIFTMFYGERFTNEELRLLCDPAIIQLLSVASSIAPSIGQIMGSMTTEIIAEYLESL